ncbi:hypothetical protein QVD17_06768 [Tagetes erecta]|uniref:Uncharacterized protein n=1 Tax=Tagetes erecta TaxID=13708 RepID=A0AAD8LK11_TARER|nr:hypothetical protein QVD17_06768 [Tagetes erecta]
MSQRTSSWGGKWKHRSRFFEIAEERASIVQFICSLLFRKKPLESEVVGDEGEGQRQQQENDDEDGDGRRRSTTAAAGQRRREGGRRGQQTRSGMEGGNWEERLKQYEGIREL